MKASSIYILAGFATIVGSAQLETCSKCWVVDGKECCDSSTIECPNQQCLTNSETYIVGGKKLNAIRKTCGDNTTCNRCFSFSTGEGLEYRASTQCTTGYLSNAPLSHHINCTSLKKKNGFKCPACYETNTNRSCRARRKMECGGKETRCFNYVGSVEFGDGITRSIAAKGCMVPIGCTYGFAFTLGSKEMKRRKYTCTKPKK